MVTPVVLFFVQLLRLCIIYGFVLRGLKAHQRNTGHIVPEINFESANYKKQTVE